MNPFWSQIAHELPPNVPGEQLRIANLVKLDTNESPFGPSPLLMTDEWRGYRMPGREFARHETVNHSEKWARGEAGAQSAENFFSVFKRGRRLSALLGKALGEVLSRAKTA